MPTTRNLTIMFTDIVGYTARTALQSRAEHAALLAEHDRLLRPVVQRFCGTLVKSMGDGMLVSFSSSTAALRCAMAMQDSLAAHNRDKPEQAQIQLRIGLASGDVQVSQTDVFGEAVNIASRIEAITPPGQICFSASVFLAMNKAEVKAELMGSRELKGIPFKLDIYRVLPMGEDGAFLPAGGDAGEGASLLACWLAGQGVRRLAWLAVPLLAGLALWLAIGPGWQEQPPMDTVVEKPASPPVTEGAPALGMGEPLTPQERLSAIESLLEGGDVDRAQQVLRDVLAASDSSEAILLAQGHLAFARQQRETGTNIYQKALELSPALASNPRLAANLVSALGWETKLARDLIEHHMSAVMVDALAERTGMPGYWGRLHALRLLESTGHGDRILQLEAALLDLKEADGCERKRDAVRRLGQLGDRRALAALRPIADMSLLRQFTSPQGCLVEDARAAVGRIDGGSKGGAAVEDRR